MTVYAKIENGQIITAYNGYNGIIGIANNIDLMTANGFKPFDEEIISKYFAGQAEIQADALVDITETDEYKAKVTVQENLIKKADLQAKIEELDKKRVRAGFEPAIKDEASGQTWLEYYTSQIQDLREQISQLNV